MSDQRSVMKEFRFLDQKRQATGLSPEEATRYAQLRDLVGPETAAPPRAGFDVNAAAARLRESLLPGGLRGQVPAPPLEPEPLPEPEAEVAQEAVALEAAWEAQPFAPLDVEPAPAADPLFDPASMGSEVRPQAWNPEAPGYDPGAPYDEAAWIAAGYDPNATYDWSAYQADGQAPQPEVAADLAGEADVAAAEPAAWPEAPAEALAETPLEDALAPAADELPFDPNAPFDHAKWFGRSTAQAAPSEATPPVPAEAYDAAPMEAAGEAAEVPELEPLAELEPELEVDLAAEQAPPQFEAESAWTAADVAQPIEIPEAPELDPGAPAEPFAAEGAPSDAWFDATSEPPPAPSLAFGDYDADARGVPAGLAAMMVEPLPEPPPPLAAAEDLFGDGSATPYQAAPAGAPFGEYDETAPARGAALSIEEASLASLPFDPAAASAIEPGGMPEGYDLGGPSLDPAALPPPPIGGYEEAAFPADAAYGGPEGDSLPGGTPLELGEPVQDWLPEQALEQGFQLASDGSFGEVDHPVLTPVPGWATVEEVVAATAAAAPATAWESPPALDLAAPFDLAPPAPQAEPPLEPMPEPPLEPPVDELPTLAAEDILEELPPAGADQPTLEQVEPAPGLEPASEPAPLAWAADAEAQVAVAEFAAEAPFEGEIPPEIAAAFGDAAAEPAPPAAFAEPYVPPLAEAYAPPSAEPHAASPLFSEPPPAAGPAFDAGEAEAESSVEPAPLPGPGAAPQVWIEGSHRVVLHTVDGQVKRGLLVDAALDAVELALQPQGPGAPEAVGTDNVKAIFFMLAPGEKAATPEGKKVRVTFRDGRQVAGYSPDYVEGTVGFFMIPADTRTNTGRIWVYQAAVRQVSVS